MLRSLNLLKDLPMQATDGEAGSVDGFFFDDEKWVVRYLALNMDERFGGRHVLISPVAIESPDPETGEFRVNLSREQLGSCPEFSVEEPLTREQEGHYHRYFAWPLYWGGGYSGFWGAGAYPGWLATAPVEQDPTPDVGVGAEADEAPRAESRLHIRNTDTFKGYTVLAPDGTRVGQVDDFVMDDRTWALAYVAVYTGRWLGGKRVLVPVECFDAGSWAAGKVNVTLPPETIATAPEWEPLEVIPDEYEARLHAHYGRPRYVVDSDTEARAAA